MVSWLPGAFRPTLATIVVLMLAVPDAPALTIVPDDIVEIPSGVSGSGNGTLDLRMATFSGSEITNANFDNGNNTLPQGGGADISLFDESYVTTGAELQAYYTLNFGATAVGDTQLVIFLDLNETGGGQANNTLRILDIILNPTSIQGSPDPTGDVTSDEQAAINQVYSGGTRIVELDPEPAENLPVNSQGAGFADYAIATGIDPFALSASDVLLFNFSMSTLNNGAEEFFLSGVFAGSDVPGVPAIPEPGTAPLLGLGLLALASRQRKS